MTLAGGPEETDVEADVVADDHGVADELEERRQHRSMRGAADTITSDETGEHGDLRGDGPARVHQRLEGAEALDRPAASPRRSR